MSNRRRTRDIALAVVIAAIFALEIGGVLTQQVARPHLAAYLIQLFATFIGAVLAVAIGLLLFDYQTEETDERRRRQLLEALAGELQATRDVLESSPSSIQLQPPKEVGAQGEAAVEIVLTHVEPVVCEQAMRAAVFSSKDTFGLSHLAREMRLYNDAVNVFRLEILGACDDKARGGAV
jgi:hypothetical protein